MSLFFVLLTLRASYIVKVLALVTERVTVLTAKNCFIITLLPVFVHDLIIVSMQNIAIFLSIIVIASEYPIR